MEMDQYVNEAESQYESTTENQYGDFNENDLNTDMTASQIFQASNSKSVISSKSYITHLKRKKADKDAIIIEKMERKKKRLEKAEEKLYKFYQNVKNLRSQIS